jgi:hypothetical protein
VQLAALMLEVCDHHLVALMQIMDELLDNNQVQLRSDVVDFSDLVSLWAFPIFVYHFPKEFVLRMVDLLFAEVPSAFPNILYGILWFFQDDLSSIQDFSKLYTFFYWIPESLNTIKIDRIFKVGFDLILNFPDLLKLE